MKRFRAILKLLVLVVIVGAVIGFLTQSDKTQTTEPAKQASLPLGPNRDGSFSDDVDGLVSNLADTYVKRYTDMPEALFELGNPNFGPQSFPDPTCSSHPELVSIYNDVKAWKDDKNGRPEFTRGAYAVTYENLHCQPDLRAYRLVGIHPIPGQWSKAAGIK